MDLLCRIRVGRQAREADPDPVRGLIDTHLLDEGPDEPAAVLGRQDVPDRAEVGEAASGPRGISLLLVLASLLRDFPEAVDHVGLDGVGRERGRRAGLAPLLVAFEAAVVAIDGTASAAGGWRESGAAARATQKPPQDVVRIAGRIVHCPCRPVEKSSRARKRLAVDQGYVLAVVELAVAPDEACVDGRPNESQDVGVRPGAGFVDGAV